MKRSGLMFLLLSGCVLVCHLQSDVVVRRFHVVEVPMNWTEARNHCREKFTNLAKIEHLIQNKAAHETAGSGKFWIGLFNSSWIWSQETHNFSVETSFNNWATNEPRLQCATMSKLGMWFTKECESLYSAMCYSADFNKHFLLKQTMSWFQAQTSCRSTYTDLSSITSQADNDEVYSLLQSDMDPTEATVGESSSEESPDVPNYNVWIGLRRHNWTWSDHSYTTYSQWGDKAFDKKGDCVMMDSKGKWITAPCSDRHSFLCHSDVGQSASRSVKVRLSVGSGDPNDPAMQDAILLQMKRKLERAGIQEEVKLRWRRQPDGKVFHREKEEGGGGGGGGDDCQ